MVMKMEHDEFTVYLTSAEVAEMAGVKVATVNSARNKGELRPAARIGFTWGYVESEVRRWMKWREENPPESRRWGWNGSGTPARMVSRSKKRRINERAFLMFPAGAGMSPRFACAAPSSVSVPRISGDEPCCELWSTVSLACSPRERG